MALRAPPTVASGLENLLKKCSFWTVLSGEQPEDMAQELGQRIPGVIQVACAAEAAAATAANRLAEVREEGEREVGAAASSLAAKTAALLTIRLERSGLLQRLASLTSSRFNHALE